MILGSPGLNTFLQDSDARRHFTVKSDLLLWPLDQRLWLPVVLTPGGRRTEGDRALACSTTPPSDLESLFASDEGRSLKEYPSTSVCRSSFN